MPRSEVRRLSSAVQLSAPQPADRAAHLAPDLAHGRPRCHRAYLCGDDVRTHAGAVMAIAEEMMRFAVVERKERHRIAEPIAGEGLGAEHRSLGGDGERGAVAPQEKALQPE